LKPGCAYSTNAPSPFFNTKKNYSGNYLKQMFHANFRQTLQATTKHYHLKS